MKKAIILIVTLFLVPLTNAQEVFVNKPQSENDKRYDYPHQLLQMILDETESEYQKDVVTHSELEMTRNRMLLSLIKGDLLHVVAEAPKKEWLEKLLVVRIPIRKGIQGYRLFFINEKDQTSIAKMNSLKDFMTLPTGSGEGWSTAKIMSAAGFNVVTGSSYDGLFDMLANRRFLTLGRGINEIAAEYQAQKPTHPNLAIESTIAVHIPLPTYFFISPQKPQLAERIEKGLSSLIEKGDFDKFFLAFHSDIIESSNLKGRKIYAIPNPNLSDADPLENKQLWYTF